MDYLRNLRNSLRNANNDVKRRYMPNITNNTTNMYQVVNKLRSDSMRYRMTGKRAYGIYMNKTKNYFGDTFSNMKKQMETGRFFDDTSALNTMMDKYAGDQSPTDYASSLGTGGNEKTLNAIQSTAKAMTTGTDYLAGIISSGNSEAQINRYQQHTESMGVLGNIQNIAEQQLNFTLNEVNTYMQQSLQMHQQSLGLLSEISSKLDMLVASRVANNNMKDYELESIFHNGRVDTKKLLGRGFANTKKTAKGYLNMGKMVIGSFADEFKNNPIGSFFKYGSQLLLSESAKDKIKKADLGFGEMMARTLLYGFNGMANDKFRVNTGLGKDSSKLANDFIRFLGESFGMDTKSGMKLSSGDYRNKQITLEVENKKVKAITEVIPDYLGKILYSLTGVDMVYNYKTAKFMSRQDRQDELTRQLKQIRLSAAENADAAGLTGAMKKIAMTNEIRNQMQALNDDMIMSGDIGALNGLRKFTFGTVGGIGGGAAAGTGGGAPTGGGGGASTGTQTSGGTKTTTSSPKTQQQEEVNIKNLGKRFKGIVSNKVQKKLSEFAWYNSIFGNNETGEAGIIGNINRAASYALYSAMGTDKKEAKDLFGDDSVISSFRKSMEVNFAKTLSTVQDSKLGKSEFGKFIFGDPKAEKGSNANLGLIGNIRVGIEDKLLGPKGIIGGWIKKQLEKTRTRKLDDGSEETFTIKDKINSFTRRFFTDEDTLYTKLAHEDKKARAQEAEEKVPEVSTSEQDAAANIVDLMASGEIDGEARGTGGPLSRGKLALVGEQGGMRGFELAYLSKGSQVFSNADSRRILLGANGINNLSGFASGTDGDGKSEKKSMRSSGFGRFLASSGTLTKDAILSTILTGTPVPGIIIGSMRNKKLNKAAAKEAKETVKTINEVKKETGDETGGNTEGEGGGSTVSEVESPGADKLMGFMGKSKNIVGGAILSTLITGSPVPGIIIGALRNKRAVKKAEKESKKAVEQVETGGEGKVKGFFKRTGTLLGAATISTILTGSPVAGIIVGSLINKHNKKKHLGVAKDAVDATDPDNKENKKEEEKKAKKKGGFIKKLFNHLKKGDGKKFADDASRTIENGGKEGQEAVDATSQMGQSVQGANDIAAETGNPGDQEKAQAVKETKASEAMGGMLTKLTKLGKIGTTAAAITTSALALVLGGTIAADAIDSKNESKYINTESGSGRRTGRGIPYYNQNDSRWRNKSFGLYGNSRDTIGAGGCGPTTAAMMLSGITGANINPSDAANYALQYGYKDSNGGVGSDYLQSISNAYGVNTTTSNGLSGNAIAALGSGVPVALMGRGGNLFGKGNHWVLARGASNGKIYAYDPQNPSNNRRAFSVGEVGSNTIESVSPRVFVPVNKARGALITSKGNINNYVLESARGTDSTETLISLLQTINDNLVTIGNNIVNAGSSMKNSNSSGITSYSAQRNSASKASQYTQAITA